MSGKTVYLAVYDTLADWETGYATAHLTQNGFNVRTVGPSTGPVTTMGGLRIEPDLALDQLGEPGDTAVFMLPGAGLWDSGDDLAPFARAARRFIGLGYPVAAICGATAGLAREGVLDGVAHTSAARAYLDATGYGGGGHYRDTDAVTDGNLITAGPTEPVAFAREVFALLGVYEGEKLDAWYRLFKHSDASAYETLTS
ncbi:DJ-1/PfpI family protein [Streptomyces sp. NBC_01498]|uniref:DJ-1/PfpI family protein n=1 Tax=Streptomyces sp. NBC_01498 TaxID=2975870 RepID=UPI002E7B032C|nr:DJ-1/PfpI family protein [Streptomyces sp. NBC_01498]WTL25524.1 DJ-1/PfpI family protein [Streptomyces sp. NBC_01498]